MSKVVIERPRSGGGVKSPKGEKRRDQRIPWEEKPRSEKIDRKWNQSWYTKHLTDVLGPLYGYLLKNVGRPWDAVYHDICQHLRRENVAQDHIRDHVDDFVEKNVIIIDGVPCRLPDEYPLDSYGRFDKLYVHPKTGLLCRVKRQQRRWKPAPPRYIKVDESHICLKLEGLWYLVEVVSFTPSYQTQISKIGNHTFYFSAFVPVDDLILGSIRYGDDVVRKYGGYYRSVSKKQMSKKEIKKLIPADKRDMEDFVPVRVV